MSPPTPETPPKNLLGRLCWNFGTGNYSTPEDFGAAVLQYQMDIVQSSNGWEPDAMILPYRRVRIHWEGLDRQQNEMIDKENIVESSSSKGFTALDLLYKVHQIMVEDCKLIDHCFFEGFEHVRGPDKSSGIVEYAVAQGS